MQNNLRTNEAICQCNLKSTFLVWVLANCYSVDGQRAHFSSVVPFLMLLAWNVGMGPVVLNVDTPLCHHTKAVLLTGRKSFT